MLTVPSAISRTSYYKALLLAALALGGLFPVIKAGSESPTIPQVYVHARRYSFIPGQITLKKGQTVKLILISDDVMHGLTVKGLGIRSDIVKGHRTELLVTPTEAGDFRGSCSVYCGSGHRDMDFLVHVVD